MAAADLWISEGLSMTSLGCSSDILVWAAPPLVGRRGWSIPDEPKQDDKNGVFAGACEFFQEGVDDGSKVTPVKD